MSKSRSIPLALLATLAAASPAYAGTSGSFTVRAARAAAARDEHGLARVQRCWRVNARHVDCTVITTVETIATNLAPVQLEWTVTVTRDGACPTPMLGHGVAHGSDTGWHGCYAGPLTVVADPATLQFLAG